MSFFFRHSGETVSRHFHRVLDGLIEVEGKILKQHDGTQVPPQILNNHRFYPYFNINKFFCLIQILISFLVHF
ncbi:unnamed protein product [Lathyrus sativus]|nr:unnamed protein product [Lathyrus sativus]